jgi:hypothetical protein
MSLYDLAKADIQQITSNPDEWSREITFTAPTGEIAIINGLHTKHHLGIDTEGARVNSKNAHISISEKLLTDASYPVRNAIGEVSLFNHRVAVADSTGIVKNYKITENYPDETIGLIVCILSDLSI